jgi:cytoskeletal protein CcmA (bactofilin family)
MTTLGRTLSLKGELRALDDLTIEGRVHGPVVCERGSVVVAASAEVTGNILARDITVFGRLAGQLIATDVVEVRAGANVTGQIISRRFILEPAATFNGHVQPQHLEAALRVAKYNQKREGEMARD